jgi:hypothetical protein
MLTSHRRAVACAAALCLMFAFPSSALAQEKDPAGSTQDSQVSPDDESMMWATTTSDTPVSDQDDEFVQAPEGSEVGITSVTEDGAGSDDLKRSGIAEMTITNESAAPVSSSPAMAIAAGVGVAAALGLGGFLIMRRRA